MEDLQHFQRGSVGTPSCINSMKWNKLYKDDTQVMTFFQNFNFMTSINNLSILVTVAVLSTSSHDCFPSFWRLFESFPPEVWRPGRDLGPNCELLVLAVLEVPSATELFQASKCMEITRRDVLGISWMD